MPETRSARRDHHGIAVVTPIQPIVKNYQVSPADSKNQIPFLDVFAVLAPARQFFTKKTGWVLKHRARLIHIVEV